MADSTSIVSYHDPFQTTDPSSSSFFIDGFDLGISEPILENETYTFNDQSGQEWDNLLDPEDPLSDPVIWELCHGSDDATVNPQTGFLEEGCSSHGGMKDEHQKNSNFEDQSMPFSCFSVPPSQYNCVCCHVLREITHANGVYVKRLEIHGAFGVITHAVLGVYDYNTSLQSHDFLMFDFQKESTEMVKLFLIQYFEACRNEGYTPMQDPLSTFYEALSVGLNEQGKTNDFTRSSPLNARDDQYNQNETMINQPQGGNDESGFMKIPLSMQRERTRQLKLKDFVDYFGFPIGEAARKLKLCPTVVKKICRKHGVLRWPYRKIRSIEGKLSKLAKILDSSDNEERKRAQQEIQKYNQELANIYQPFTK